MIYGESDNVFAIFTAVTGIINDLGVIRFFLAAPKAYDYNEKAKGIFHDRLIEELYYANIVKIMI